MRFLGAARRRAAARRRMWPSTWPAWASRLSAQSLTNAGKGKRSRVVLEETHQQHTEPMFVGGQRFSLSFCWR
eukprot:9112988-Heterocapsa_arctica.AAC.1